MVYYAPAPGVKFPVRNEEGGLSFGVHFFVPPRAIKPPVLIAWCVFLCVALALSQKPQPEDNSLPKYDLQTEAKTNGIVEDTKLLTVGSRKDFVQLILKSGDDKVAIYLCPKSFEDEIGVTFSKGDEITVTGSKVKQDTSEVILAREVVRGTDTLLFRDNKGKPVWDWRTGK